MTNPFESVEIESLRKKLDVAERTITDLREHPWIIAMQEPPQEIAAERDNLRAKVENLLKEVKRLQDMMQDKRRLCLNCGKSFVVHEGENRNAARFRKLHCSRECGVDYAKRRANERVANGAKPPPSWRGKYTVKCRGENCG